MGRDRACYVFGVMREASVPLPDDVETVRDGALIALMTEVSPADFPEDVSSLDSSEDLEWLERYARLHDRVLNAAVTDGAVLPLRFGTVVGDRTDVRTLLQRHADVFGAWLDELTGRAEHTVKLWADEAALTDETPVAGAAGPARSGTAYLQRRQAERAGQEQARHVRGALVSDVHDRLAAVVGAATTVPTRPDAPRPHPTHHGAYLATASQQRALAAEVEELAREHDGRGVRLELAGPWPAHHFLPESWEQAGGSG